MYLVTLVLLSYWLTLIIVKLIIVKLIIGKPTCDIAILDFRPNVKVAIFNTIFVCYVMLCYVTYNFTIIVPYLGHTVKFFVFKVTLSLQLLFDLMVNIITTTITVI